jgi:hypothetical protein
VRTLLLAGLVASLLVRPAAANNGDRWEPATLFVQAGGGVAGVVIGGGTVGLGGLLLGSALGRKGDWGAPLAGAVVGVVVGGFSGLVIGVQLTGDAREGTGRWWATAGGAAVGTGAVVALALATEQKRGFNGIKAAGFVTLILGSTIVAYHLSSDAHAPPMAVPLTLHF